MDPLALAVPIASDSVQVLPMETEDQHKKRHPNFLRFSSCARCFWGKHRDAVQKSCSVALPDGRRVSYITERPQSWGGQWGLGCVACAAFRSDGRGSSSTWASYNVCSLGGTFWIKGKLGSQLLASIAITLSPRPLRIGCSRVWGCSHILSERRQRRIRDSVYSSKQKLKTK